LLIHDTLINAVNSRGLRISLRTQATIMSHRPRGLLKRSTLNATGLVNRLQRSRTVNSPWCLSVFVQLEGHPAGRDTCSGRSRNHPQQKKWTFPRIFLHDCPSGRGVSGKFFQGFSRFWRRFGTDSALDTGYGCRHRDLVKVETSIVH